jgi:hypothetical protein
LLRLSVIDGKLSATRGMHMVLPLIPVALIAVGAITGGGGLAMGGKGALDIKKAVGDLNKARADYEERRAQSVTRIGETNDRVIALGCLQREALTEVVMRMADFLRRHEKQVREHQRLLVDGLDAETNLVVVGPGGVDLNLGAWVAGVLGSAGAAAGVGAGVPALAGTVGVAGTGAAISGLSGVAAESAMLAWLGGGTLASGGGGMALGAAALNVVTIGPALLVGGFVVLGQGQKALTKAKAFQSEIAVAIAKLDATDARLHAVDERVEELTDVLAELSSRAVIALDDLESEPFDPLAHAPRFQRALTLTVAVRDVAAAQILDEAGGLTEQSATLAVKYRGFGEGSEDERSA